MDKKDIESLIEEKSKHYQSIATWKGKLVSVKTEYRKKVRELWIDTNWEVEIGSRATVDAKKAYINDECRELKEKIEKCENMVDGIRNEIDIVNDKLKYLGDFDD